jgi:hypothetical protein
MFFFYLLVQPQASNAYGGDYTMPNPQPTSSHNAFFSPQTAFYASSSHQPIPGMEFLQNNLLLNVAEQSMRNIGDKTVNMLPNEVKMKDKSSFLNLLI